MWWSLLLTACCWKTWWDSFETVAKEYWEEKQRSSCCLAGKPAESHPQRWLLHSRSDQTCTTLCCRHLSWDRPVWWGGTLCWWRSCAAWVSSFPQLPVRLPAFAAVCQAFRLILVFFLLPRSCVVMLLGAEFISVSAEGVKVQWDLRCLAVPVRLRWLQWQLLTSAHSCSALLISSVAKASCGSYWD